MTISLCMIVKNEERYIARCLQSVIGLMDEIIIVDTGSFDRTKEICGKFTDKIYDFEWGDDFSEARNYSFSKATMEYIMWMDADDVMLPADSVKLAQLKKNLDPNIDSIMMKYNTGHDNKGNVTFSYYRERICKRSMNPQWKEPVHEYIDIKGKHINVDIAITHGIKERATKSNRNIHIYESQLECGIPLSLRGSYYYGRELFDHARYEDAIERLNLFLDTGFGWVEDNIGACGLIAKAYFELKKHEKGLESLFRSFIYDLPRAEICCQIGYYYKEKQDYEKAFYWFHAILSLKRPKNSWGFIQHDCWDYIPLLECAVCCDYLGYIEKAQEYNERALHMKPDSLAAKSNIAYFEKKLQTLKMK